MSPEEANKIVAAFSQSREAGMKALGEYHASPPETSAPGELRLCGNDPQYCDCNGIHNQRELDAALATLREQLAQAQRRKNWLENTLEPELREQLAAAQAACKAKDEALRELRPNAKYPPQDELDEIVVRALAIQPSSDLPESSPSSPASR